MSKSSRYDLLISLVRSELEYLHVRDIDPTGVERNTILYKRCIESWILLSDDLMCEEGILLQARDTRIRNLIKCLNAHNISLVLLTLKKTYDLLLDHISTKRIICDYQDFKGLFTDEENIFLGFLISPMKESLQKVLQLKTVVRNGCFSSEATRDMGRLAQYLMFLSKINFKNVSLEHAALDDYLHTELETSLFDFNQVGPYIRPIQSIIHDWMKDWSYDGYASKHGSGSVADSSKDKVNKYLNFKMDSKVAYLYNNDINEIATILPFGGVVRSLERCSKLEFVPKNISKLRSISMEPVTLQYLQQGCMRSLYNYFESNRTLNRILKLEDQAQNKSLAYHGSITDDYATIDLSHASDSVHWELTKVLFKRVPKLLRWMVTTRSTHTLLPTGVKIRLSKFAPMGSALCFPIESLIFAAIAKLSIDLAREQALDRDDRTGIRTPNKNFSVYGDDIIIPSYAAKICISLLKRFGFTPNESKSYLTGPFKESCGGNYFCGFDITPLKFSPSFDEAYPMGVSPEAYTALCSYANLAYQRGYSLFRLHCIKLIFEGGRRPFFVDNFDEAPGIYSPTPTNFHLKKIYIKRYQKYQLIYDGVTTVEKTTSSDLKDHVDHIFLYDYLQNKEINYREGVATSLLQLNASIVEGKILFDRSSPYSRKTLLPQTFKYVSCKRDEIHP